MTGTLPDVVREDSRPEAVSSGLFGVWDERRPDRTQLSVWNGTDFEDLTWDDWRAEASRCAVGLRALGVTAGTPVACILTNSRAACTAAVGVWLAGGTLLSLPTPPRGMALDTYFDQLRRILAQSQAEMILVDDEFLGGLPADSLSATPRAFQALATDGSIEPSPPAADAPAFVQYSSGSTSDPKGCVLTAGAIGRQLKGLAEALQVDPAGDRGVMWLPLSHDMGFFGCLMLSFYTGFALAVGPPQRFLRSPATWFDDCARRQATITAAPNFALALAARTAESRPPAAFPMRKLVLGGERVEARTLERAIAALGGSGVSASGVLPAYGLAEAVLAVTMTPLGRGPRVLRVDGEALVEGGAVEVHQPASGTELVSAGRPLSGVTVRIDGGGDVGEILIRTPSTMAAYLAQPELTGERLIDGELRTGDLGFLDDGELFVTGRVDDMLVVGGRNVYARDIEVALGDQGGVRPGSCVLMDGADGREGVLLIAEPTDESSSFTQLAKRLAEAAFSQSGVGLDECVFVRRGSLPKTPSGKVQRFRSRSLLTDDASTAVLARVQL